MWQMAVSCTFSLLWAPQLRSWGSGWWLLDDNLGSEICIWKARIPDDCDIAVTWYFGVVQSLSHVYWYQFSSEAQLCPTLCDPMNRSTPGLPVHHQLPEFTQIHVHQVSDAIQPSHPLSSPSPPAPNPSQHQSLFQWVNSLHEVAKVLEFQL